MSRIGKTPVDIPKNVTITMSGNTCTVKGPKGELKYDVPENFKVKMDGDVLTVERPGDSKKEKALHGLARTLIKNMTIGVSEGFAKTLTIVGVGYKALAQGTGVQINIGYSHPLVFKDIPGIEFEVPNQTTIVVKGIDKEKVGQVAADIRSVRPPEPYKGKGIKYADEYVRRKVGKAGA